MLAPNPGQMTLTGTNTYLVAVDGQVAVIDPGPELPEHLQAILTAAEPLGRVTTVLVTHRHSDHLPAAVPLCARTGATLAGHPDLPGVQRPLRDLELAFAPLQALETPGHTRDSLCFWEPSERVLFTGDLVVGTGTVIVDDSPGALAAYMRSLERLLTFEPSTIYPGHGPLVTDAMARLGEYLAHRRARERQVLNALHDHGPTSVEDLVERIYVDLAPGLAPMAARNVRACLDKLADEGRVATSGPLWAAVG